MCPNFAVLFIFALKKKTSYPSKKIFIILSHEYSALLSLVWLLWTNSIKPLIISWLELVLECGPSDSNFSRVCRHDKEQLKSRHGWRDVVYLLINNTTLNIYGIGVDQSNFVKIWSVYYIIHVLSFKKCHLYHKFIILINRKVMFIFNLFLCNHKSVSQMRLGTLRTRHLGNSGQPGLIMD